ncbi:ABC-three component system middle component 2 [Arthrobacter gandavensis]|uniref:ABC-three component system middle component 2 n=1 Tax=Arthrobacter gandavensis TaxID=169960 RepID=UPI003A5C6428
MQPLNSPLEVGLRSLIVLTAVFPRKLDVRQLSVLDHLLLRSGDSGGPPSVLPPIPARSGELGFKRTVLERGLTVMVRARLLRVVPESEGLFYQADEHAWPFLQLLDSAHADELMRVAVWIADEVGDRSNAELSNWLTTHESHVLRARVAADNDDEGTTSI